MKLHTVLGLFLLMLGASACTGNLNFVLPRQDGTWDVDKYYSVTVIGNDTILNLTYDNAGTFLFEKDGIGTVDLSVPGNSHSNQEILWSFDKDEAVLTIDWQEGNDPWEFEVIESELDFMRLRRTTVQNILGAENTNIREMELRKE